MKIPAMNTKCAYPHVIRTIAMLLSLLMVVHPLHVGADCCGGGTPPDCEGGPAKEKETLVRYTLFVGTSPVGRATIIGKYKDDGTEAFRKEVNYPRPSASPFDDCQSNTECGFFYAKDNRPIKLKLYASGLVCVCTTVSMLLFWPRMDVPAA